MFRVELNEMDTEPPLQILRVVIAVSLPKECKGASRVLLIIRRLQAVCNMSNKKIYSQDNLWSVEMRNLAWWKNWPVLVHLKWRRISMCSWQKRPVCTRSWWPQHNTKILVCMCQTLFSWWYCDTMHTDRELDCRTSTMLCKKLCSTVAGNWYFWLLMALGKNILISLSNYVMLKVISLQRQGMSKRKWRWENMLRAVTHGMRFYYIILYLAPAMFSTSAPFGDAASSIFQRGKSW